MTWVWDVRASMHLLSIKHHHTSMPFSVLPLHPLYILQMTLLWILPGPTVTLGSPGLWISLEDSISSITQYVVTSDVLLMGCILAALGSFYSLSLSNYLKLVPCWALPREQYVSQDFPHLLVSLGNQNSFFLLFSEMVPTKVNVFLLIMSLSLDIFHCH